MKAYGKMMLILLSFLSFAHCTDVLTMTSSDEENGAEPNVMGGGEEHSESHEPNATAAAGRTGRQYYQPSAVAGFAYQPYPQRRAYKGPYPRTRQRTRAKPGRRQRPRRRPAGPPPVPMHLALQQQGRYRRLPPTLRPQHSNYIDSPPLTDYDDGFESSPSFDYGEREFDREPAAAYVHFGPDATPMAVVPSPSSPVVRSRKRPAQAVAADEPQAIVHVPVRVQARPFATAAPTAAALTAVAVDPMDKLRQMVQEAMDEHFANRHQELYADGFDKQLQQNHGQAKYSAKYKRQQAAAAVDKDKQQQQQQQQQQRSTEDDAVAVPYTPPSSPSSTKKSDASYPSRAPPPDADADGSDDRLTLAEISAYMGSKPAETVLSAGGRRYVLSDALQQIYQRPQHQDHQHQRQYDVDEGHGLHRGQQYLRYVSPFEAIYELPAARWTY